MAHPAHRTDAGLPVRSAPGGDVSNHLSDGKGVLAAVGGSIVCTFAVYAFQSVPSVFGPQSAADLATEFVRLGAPHDQPQSRD